MVITNSVIVILMFDRNQAIMGIKLLTKFDLNTCPIKTSDFIVTTAIVYRQKMHVNQSSCLNPDAGVYFPTCMSSVLIFSWPKSCIDYMCLKCPS